MLSVTHSLYTLRGQAEDEIYDSSKYAWRSYWQYSHLSCHWHPTHFSAKHIWPCTLPQDADYHLVYVFVFSMLLRTQ